MMWDSLNPMSLQVNTHVYVGSSDNEVLRMVREGVAVYYAKKGGGLHVACNDGVIRKFNHWMEKL